VSAAKWRIEIGGKSRWYLDMVWYLQHALFFISLVMLPEAFPNQRAILVAMVPGRTFFPTSAHRGIYMPMCLAAGFGYTEYPFMIIAV
jgi:hypothetical protein